MNDNGIKRRLDRIDAALHDLTSKVNRALGMSLGDANRDNAMTKSVQALTAEVEDLRTKVEKYTTDQGERIKEAVAQARAAFEAENQAEIDAATKKLDEIGNSLVEFSPSGNA